MSFDAARAKPIAPFWAQAPEVEPSSSVSRNVTWWVRAETTYRSTDLSNIGSEFGTDSIKM